uniref:Uncharacterized protein n=1 Tax=Avena sativa TaxID=4498 RepID=A0ACD5TI84_AVESA
MAVVQAASVLGSFPFRAAVVVICVLLLPLLPSPRAPAAGEGDGGGRGQAFLDKVWELLHLLLVGIAVSYGLFSRRNDAGGRVGGGEKDAAAAAGKTDARYVSRMLQGDLVFDDDGDDRVPDSPGGGGARSWSALHHPEEPVVVMATGGGGRSHAAAQQAPLSLPVRTLKHQDSVSGAAGYDTNGEPRPRPRAQETVLPSPIPWRSRSGRFDAPTSSPSPSPKRLSPASSMSSETLAKASEEPAAVPKRRSTYKSSMSSPPPPPPPPPPFLVHGYHPVAERRATAAKSFKEELQDHSTRGRGDRDRYSQSSHGFSNSSAYTNSSPANPRSSFDGSSSSSSPSVGKSVRTIRPREGIQPQPQIQELPEEDEAGDSPDNSHGPEEPYGYNAYQSIPRFQYERGSSDPILGKVTVSSDETESSDDEAYSTKTNSPRESPELDENEVDKKAEEFIAKFRESIRLQRIASIKKSAGPRGVKHGK